MALLENIDKIAQREGVLTEFIGWVIRGKEFLMKTDSQKSWKSASAYICLLFIMNAHI